jgi:hypothetical protein
MQISKSKPKKISILCTFKEEKGGVVKGIKRFSVHFTVQHLYKLYSKTILKIVGPLQK